MLEPAGCCMTLSSRRSSRALPIAHFWRRRCRSSRCRLRGQSWWTRSAQSQSCPGRLVAFGPGTTSASRIWSNAWRRGQQASGPRTTRPAGGGCFGHAIHYFGPGNQRGRIHDRRPRRGTDQGGRVTNGSDTSVTIDVHHHILPDFFWRETNDSAHPVGCDASSAA